MAMSKAFTRESDSDQDDEGRGQRRAEPAGRVAHQPQPERQQPEGLRVVDPAQACAEADVIMVLVPDPAQRGLYAEAIAPNLKAGDAVFFAHGFNIRFGFITPPDFVDVCMVAPKGPGHLVRREYVAGRGVPDIVAVEQDATGNAWPLTLSYAKAMGGLRAGGILTTFTEETETDLFGEQSVLCGGASQLVQYGFETLIAQGESDEEECDECLEMGCSGDCYFESCDRCGDRDVYDDGMCRDCYDDDQEEDEE